jgi:hypothetical protein
MLRQIFRRSSHFGLSAARDSDGRSPLLLACFAEYVKDDEFFQSFDSRRHVQRLEFLLGEGCNIHDNDQNGLTCLHTFFNFTVPPPSEQNWKDSLIYLICQGADPYALDRFGRSVSDIAYSKTCLNRTNSIGTYRGDLFDAVLDFCGYNVSEFRQEHSWKRKYDANYSRRDFELLWEGREYRCPNWSDPEWPITNQNNHNNVEGNHQKAICTCHYNCGFNNDADDDDDSEQEDKEVEVDYNDNIDDDGYNDNIDSDDSDDCEIQDPDLQALHGSYVNDIETAETQQFFPTTNHNYRELHPMENNYSAQSSMPESTHQQNQGQESHELLSSVWQLTISTTWAGPTQVWVLQFFKNFFSTNVTTRKMANYFTVHRGIDSVVTSGTSKRLSAVVQ